ncbi:unnamed protein product [Protopolystoma xenopodis]|uniref:Uncharacterized protein n=1 Tax=Protopolystoma xenopodis TaxID=117903 RepID=A0A448WWG0_9PLAT|nr:unnamed protein product [Protopolystoma xenopodis]
MGSLSPPSILLTTSNEASQECVTIWDPIAGNSIARLSGEQASRSRICLINGRLLVVPAAKKPLLLIWDLQTALCSGCLIGVLPNGHTGSIGELCLPFWSCHMPLLLVSADASGFLSCWDLGSLGEFNLVIKSDPEFSSRSLKHDSPATNSALWYAAQVSRGLPRLGSYRDNIIVAGTEGLKFFASRTGVVTRQKSFECPLHSLAVKEFSRLLFLGGDNGILFVTTLSNSSGDNLLVRRRCFVESR